jgi:23S rRNA (adenine2503-C2)-methyltransferase
LSTETKTNLLDLDRRAMEAFFLQLGSKAFHGRNVFKWIHKHGVTDFDAMTDISKRLREQLRAVAEIRLPELIFEQPALDGTCKWLIELADGQRVETVYIPDDGRNTICVSSQVGCALDCAFCSTAQQGFNRNLSVTEIIGQVWIATRELGTPPSNIVLMGMGEPLANFDAVVTAMNIMQDDLAYMLSKYRVTVSTSGIVPALKRLKELSDISLAVSLHAPDNALRDELVPINRKYPLEQLVPACREVVKGDKRREVTCE